MKVDHETPWRSLLKLLEQDLVTREHGGKTTQESSAAWLEVRRRIYAYAVAISRNRSYLSDEDAEDLASGILLRLQDPKLVRRMTRIGVPAGYFYTMLRHAAIDLWKRRQFQRTPLDEARVDALLHEATRAGEERSKLVMRLRQEILQLTEEERHLIQLRFDQRLKLQEIADHLGVTFSAAAVRLHRLIRKLKSRLDAQ